MFVFFFGRGCLSIRKSHAGLDVGKGTGEQTMDTTSLAKQKQTSQAVK